jgi:hypothetical protein
MHLHHSLYFVVDQVQARLGVFIDRKADPVNNRIIPRVKEAFKVGSTHRLPLGSAGFRGRFGAHSPAEAEGDPVSTDLLRPRDHAEEIALFRAEIIGALVTVARALVEDCDHLLAALDDYWSHLVVERPRNPDQLDWPF